MTPADREGLRRVAYGPDATAEERAVAASALRELDEQARVAREALRASAVAKGTELDDTELDEPVEASGEGSGHLADDDDGELPLWQRRIRIGWLIPIAIGSLLLGVFGAVGTSSQFRGPDPVPAASDGGAVGEATPGDLKAADEWFTAPYLAMDYYPGPAVLNSYGIDQLDVRFSGGNGAWVARTESALCLLAVNYDSERGARCVSRAEFGRSGITLSVGDLTFDWRGKDVKVTGIRPAEENAILEAPEPGPGDVDAANSYFDVPAAATDAFPIPGGLDRPGRELSEVRHVGSDVHGHGLWVAKERSGGFCLVAYDIRKGESTGNCATLHEFETSGVRVSTGGFAASWNGTEFVATGEFRLIEP